MKKDVDRYGRPKISVKLCSSATCQGSEIGCSNGDCAMSGYHLKNAKWRYWTIDRFRKIFGREPR